MSPENYIQTAVQVYVRSICVWKHKKGDAIATFYRCSSIRNFNVTQSLDNFQDNPQLVDAYTQRLLVLSF